MSWLERLILTLQAVRELGIQQPVLNAIYRLELRAGFFSRQHPPVFDVQPSALNPPKILHIPSRDDLTGVLADRKDMAIAEADEICQGIYHPFGGPPATLEFKSHLPLRHWCEYEYRPTTHGSEDIKYIWEPARFGWVFPLGRAFLLTGDEKYPYTFLTQLHSFLKHNPAYQGPNWLSSQEAALRLMAIAFAWQVFRPALSQDEEKLLATAIHQHASRIPPTLLYARSQNNNHLLSEAVGLITAAYLLPNATAAKNWSHLGWKWFTTALLTQVAGDGTYIQHSTNYQRVMLHLSLWVNAIAGQSGKPLPIEILERLGAATRWLYERCDQHSGRVSNLGHNDGSNILPLAAADIYDYRPTLQAASLAFLGKSCIPSGAWDEMSLWLFGSSHSNSTPESVSHLVEHRLILDSGKRWASLRAVHFHSRPAHADQLHIDIWQSGENIALDAGTYLYNGQPPWENILTSCLVHNTISVDGKEPMQRAGKFLWVNWAQARYLPSPTGMITGETGCANATVLHRRTLFSPSTSTWQIDDQIIPLSPSTRSHIFILHWLLPDYPWQVQQSTLLFNAPFGNILLTLNGMDTSTHTSLPSSDLQIIRAGQGLMGSGNIPPFLGWYSPTYGVKIPALSVRLQIKAVPPITIHSIFNFN
jgi:hypothetical protein